jgi:Ca2+-binding EF-hand superfamily protein
MHYYQAGFGVPDGKVGHELWLEYHADLGVRYIDDATFVTVLRKLYFLPQDCLEEVSKATLEEGIKTFRYKLIQSSANAHDEMKMMELFYKFDTGQKKYLDRDDLHALSILLKADLKPKILDALFRRFDANSNGQISFKEFKDFILMKEYPS